MSGYVHIVRLLIVFSLLLISKISFPLWAQTIVPKFDELPVTAPNCFLHDSNGFLWIGAQEGLLRYDGYKFKNFTQIPFDSTSISINWVTVIKEDRIGNLWVGTSGGGLNYFDQRTEKFTRYMHEKNKSNTICSNNITSIISNDDGTIWIGTRDCGLIHMKTDSNGIAHFENYILHKDPTSTDLSGENFILTLYKDNKGILWIGTITGGLKKFNPKTEEITHFRNDPQNPSSISSNVVSSICEDKNGNIWIGTGDRTLWEGNGLNKFNSETNQFNHFKHNPDDPSSLSSNDIFSLSIDSQNILWIGTGTDIINTISLQYLLSGQNIKFESFTDLPGACVNSIYEDRLGNIWIALLGRKVIKYDPQQNPFSWYRHIENEPNSLNCIGVNSIFIDNLGNIWFGSCGLNKYDPNIRKYTHYLHQPNDLNSLSSNWIRAICQDKNGFLWIGTSDQGLNWFDPVNGKFKHFKQDSANTFGLKSNFISKVITSQTGDLWIGFATGGLQLFDLESKHFISFDNNPINASENISYIYEDNEGTLWIGTLSNGLYGLTFKDRIIESTLHYKHNPADRNSLSNNLVSDIVRAEVSDSSSLWIATNVGLNRLDLRTRTFTHFFEKDGLSDNLTLKVLEDNNGNIWVTTKTGLDMLDVATGKFKNYSEADGLPFTRFGGSRQNAFKSSDGQLFFSGSGGTLGFYPKKLKDNLNIPPIRITDFKIFHESAKLDTAIQFKKNIILNYDQDAISFEFAALNFTNAEKNQYAYKLEGLYEDWIYIGNERVASFTDIEPGEYVFRVKGSNNHGIWNETGASVVLIITPPWWATTWAYIIYALVILSIIYFIWRAQLKRIRIKHDYEMSKFETDKMHEVDEMKSRFFANISHEFRTPLTLILGLAKKIVDKSKDNTSKEDAGIIKRNANRLHRLVNQILDLSKLETENMILQTYPQNIIPLLKGLVLSFASFAERKRITLKFNSDEEEIVVYLDKDKFEKIVTNLLSNAFKFTPKGGEIVVSISKPTSSIPLPGGDTGVGTVVEMSIRDTGIGISPDRINKIFDRFYQVDSSHTREREGTGLGLALTKELVELHKGQIKVDSSEGKCSTFTVTLPLGKDHLKSDEIIEAKIETEEVVTDEVEISPEYEEQKVGSDIEVITDTDKLLVLIVEDNADVRNYIKGNLEEEYRILEAVNGEDGLNQAINHIPDLIISDVMMPKMDGLKLCEKLKTDERTSHIPVILLTAKAADKDKIVGYETGADDYIMKPFDAEVLRTRINNLIQQRKRLREHFKKEGIFQINDADVTSTDKAFLKKALDIINNNISDETFSVDVFAEEIAMSRSQLRRKLVALVGEAPSDLIKSIRLRKAAKLIEQKFGNISEIAAEVGFNNPANFARSFKTQFGMSPSDYLNSKKA